MSDDIDMLNALVNETARIPIDVSGPDVDAALELAAFRVRFWAAFESYLGEDSPA